MSFITQLFGKKSKESSWTESVNAQTNGYQEITAAAYKADFHLKNVAHTLIDVRTPEEFANAHLTGARNIPIQELAQCLADVPTDKPVVAYCRTGNRSGMAAQLLHEAGYEHVYNAGGLEDLAAQGLPVENRTG